MEREESLNVAYIDNQNLQIATKSADHPWRVDMKRFRVYLREKYKVERAYLFMGAFDPERQRLYTMFQDFGYSLVWRLHAMEALGHKKGNVDTDIVFYIMKDCYEDDCGVVLVSGDGDFCRTIEHVHGKGKLVKVLLPSHENASSLYNRFGNEFKDYLDSNAMKKRFARKENK